MKLTTKTQYAAIVLNFMAKDINKIYKCQTLANACTLDKKYLEQILRPLVQAGILAAFSGKKGGYLLNYPDINLYDVARAVQESNVQIVNMAFFGYIDAANNYLKNTTVKELNL